MLLSVVNISYIVFDQVVFFILQYLNIQRYSDLEILEACGKLDTNCFEIKQNGLNLRAMYRTACIMSHNCRCEFHKPI